MSMLAQSPEALAHVFVHGGSGHDSTGSRLPGMEQGEVFLGQSGLRGEQIACLVGITAQIIKLMRSVRGSEAKGGYPRPPSVSAAREYGRVGSRTYTAS